MSNEDTAMGADQSLPTFRMPYPDMPGNPSISVYNGTQYVLQVEDDFFESCFRLQPREEFFIGSNLVGMTRVKIRAYDHRERLVKLVEFKTWTGFSWIIKDDGIKQQRYGSGNLTEEEPNGPFLLWQQDLATYLRETDEREEEEFLRTVQERREEAIRRGVDVASVAKVTEEGDEEPIGDLACKVCWSKKSRIMFEPCCHLVTCIECSSQLTSCCICRKDITKKHRVYF